MTATQFVHGFTGTSAGSLNFVALVRDDAVGMPAEQLSFQSPRGFVVHHQYLQGAGRAADDFGLVRQRASEQR